MALDDPILPMVLASCLKSSIVGRGDADSYARYWEAARRIDPDVVWTGVAMMSDDYVIACAMVALNLWTIEYARLVLRVSPVAA
jgi:hypothetical protein